MSGAGINPLAITNPDLYVKQLAIQRRQALAQSLLEQGGQSGGSAAYGGLANAGKSMLGAYLLNRSDKDMAGIIPQISNAYMGGGQPSQSNISPEQNQVLGQRYGADAASQITNNAGASDTAQTSQAQGGGGIIRDVPGLSHLQSVIMYSNQPAAYWKAIADAGAPTPDMKNAQFANPDDVGAQRNTISGMQQKGGSIEVRPEGFIRLPNGQIVYGPNENSNTYYTTGPNNEPVAHPILGGPEAAASQAGAVERAKEQNKIEMIELSDGRKVPMYMGDAVGGTPSGGGQPLGVRSNNPGNLQPGGKESNFATPTAGIVAASENLNRYVAGGARTLTDIISKWAPPDSNDTRAYIQDVAQRMGGVDPNRPLNLRDPNVKGALLEAIFHHENGSAYNGGQPQSGQPGQSMGITPPAALPQIGQTTAQKVAQEKLGAASGEASANNAHIQATTDATLKAIQGLIDLNDKTPDSAGLPPEYKAALDKRASGLSKYLGTGGDAGALAQWEQLSSQGVLGGIKQLGLGRLDIPIVKQIQESNGIPADLPRSERVALLNQLKTAIINNRSVAQNTAANLNQPGVGNVQGQAPVSGYNQGRPAPQDIVDELRRRGLVK